MSDGGKLNVRPAYEAGRMATVLGALGSQASLGAMAFRHQCLLQ